jgi:hypothetical protein
MGCSILEGQRAEGSVGHLKQPNSHRTGTLATGAEAFTAFTEGGYMGSKNFNIQVTNPQNIAAITKLMGW